MSCKHTTIGKLVVIVYSTTFSAHTSTIYIKGRNARWFSWVINFLIVQPAPVRNFLPSPLNQNILKNMFDPPCRLIRFGFLFRIINLFTTFLFSNIFVVVGVVLVLPTWTLNAVIIHHSITRHPHRIFWYTSDRSNDRSEALFNLSRWEWTRDDTR